MSIDILAIVTTPEIDKKLGIEYYYVFKHKIIAGKNPDCAYAYTDLGPYIALYAKCRVEGKTIRIYTLL